MARLLRCRTRRTLLLPWTTAKLKAPARRLFVILAPFSYPIAMEFSGMRNSVACLFICFFAALPAMAQTAPYRAPRLNGHPDLNGVWQAMNTANWDLLDHPAQPGPMSQTGAIGAVPAGQGVVEGGEIPY